MNPQQVRELLRYESETGQFYWRVDRTNATRAGMSAGSINGTGYVYIKVLGKRRTAHRLAWFLVHGDWPCGVIDHINGDKLDNRLANLRVVTKRQNGQNMQRHRTGRLVGASYHKPSKRWQSRIKVQGTERSLGYYDTEQEAHQAYLRASLLF
jgi:hypothetical protein